MSENSSDYEYGPRSVLSVLSEKSCEDESAVSSVQLLELNENSSEVENSSDAFTNDQFENLEKIFITCVLRDAINQLIIANNGERHVYPLEKRKPMEERFQTPRRDNVFHDRTMGRINDVMQRMVLVKLRNDTSRFRKILSEISEEMDYSGSYSTLKYYVEDEKQQENEEKQLVIDYVRNKRLLKTLEKKHFNAVDEQKARLNDLDSQIHALDNELKDLRVENEIKKKLVQKWEKSRHEQARVILHNKEKKLTEIYEDARYKRTTELELMTEIETFIVSRIDSLNAKIDYWIHRHESEVQHLDSEILKCKNRIAEIKTQNEELKIVYDARQIEIDAYMIERAKKQAIRNFAQLQWDSAVKIQAWWRGTMVRRGLGPYKRKGKKPKKPKKQAPKGKKK